MSDGGAGGSGTTWSELVSAIVPSILEIGALVILVSMETGWIDAVWGVDLEDEWFTLRRGHDIMSLKKTDSIVLHSTRPKTYGRVAAVGLAGSKFRSFQLIRALVDRTEFLRQCLRERLQLLEAQEKKVAIAAEIKKIKQRLRSPWLYYNSKGNGIDAVALGDGGSVNYALSFLKAKAIEALSSEQKHDDTLITGINALKWSDCRDALATHIYDASGGNIFLVKQALDHNNVSTTRMYLRQRRQIRERFAAFRKVTNTILEEVKNGNSVDPTILFLSVNYRDFGEVDRERLKSFRTRLGMGCSNPTSPDSFLAPHHIEGTFCLVQRCVLCRHGIIFKDAYKDLAIRRADLVWLRSNTPPNRWLTSNLSWELEAIELVRDNIFTSQIEGFDSLARDRLDEIAAGRAYVFDDPEISGKLR